MDAVINDKPFELKSRISSEYNKTVNARELWDKICEHAWRRGDPGIHFIDSSNQDSLIKKNKNWLIECTNPCGEMNLPFKVGDKDADYHSYSISNIGVEQKDYPTYYDYNPSENGTSCNLGSINLTKFVSIDKDNNKIFCYKDFIKQVRRAIYYLDLVIDISSYPLEGIERNTKAIRPVGLGIMGVHDLAIELNIPFESNRFTMLCENIGEVLGIESLNASIQIVRDIKKETFEENHGCVSDLIEEYIVNYIDASFTKDKIDQFDKYQFFYTALKEVDDHKLLPNSIKNSLIACYNSNRDLFKKIITGLLKDQIRNSRRLSIAPTGTVSLLYDVSSGIEPNFAFKWNRRVSVLNEENNESEFKILEYIHKLVPEKYKDELIKNNTINDPVFKGALEIAPEWHINVVESFSKFIDCSISKTLNYPNSATVDDIKDAYIQAYKKGIKGITIYRDGSRSNQPLTTDNKKKDSDANNTESNTDNIVKVSLDSLEKNPDVGTGTFIRIKSPYGKLYISGKFNRNDELREVFITLNKSGQELKAITEALSRLISITLQECNNFKTAYQRLIKTLKDISGFDAWVYDTIRTKEEVIVRSIPDVIAYILPDLEYMYLLNKYGSHEEAENRMIASTEFYNKFMFETNDDVGIEFISNNQRDLIKAQVQYNKNKCPQCGGTHYYQSGQMARRYSNITKN